MHFGRPPFQNLIPPAAPTNSSDSDMQRQGFVLTGTRKQRRTADAELPHMQQNTTSFFRASAYFFRGLCESRIGTQLLPLRGGLGGETLQPGLPQARGLDMCSLIVQDGMLARLVSIPWSQQGARP